MVYKYRDYERPVSADIMGKHIENLEKQNGEVTAKLLLDSARDEKSTIHNCFEWNNEIAGEKYRLQQSRNILTNLIIECEKPNHEVCEYRAFVSVSDNSKETGRYINFVSAVSNENTYKIILKKALEELQSYAKKYRDYVELQPVFDAINKIAV